MDASNGLALSQTIIVCTLLGLLLVWMILFTVLAFRSPRTKEQAAPQSARQVNANSRPALHNTHDRPHTTVSRPRIPAAFQMFAESQAAAEAANGVNHEVEAARMA